MPLNDKSVKMPELNLIPESERGVDLDVGMKQVLAVLAAYCQEKRVALRSSPGGVLFVSSSDVGDIFHVTATGANHLYQGNNVQCSEVMVMGHPDNGDTIWVRTKTQANTTNSWPLLLKEVVSFSIPNLNLLRIRIVANSEKAIVLYTK